jgi:hypothetical protein
MKKAVQSTLSIVGLPSSRVLSADDALRLWSGDGSRVGEKPEFQCSVREEIP